MSCSVFCWGDANIHNCIVDCNGKAQGDRCWWQPCVRGRYGKSCWEALTEKFLTIVSRPCTFFNCTLGKINPRTLLVLRCPVVQEWVCTSGPSQFFLKPYGDSHAVMTLFHILSWIFGSLSIGLRRYAGFLDTQDTHSHNCHHISNSFIFARVRGMNHNSFISNAHT